MFMLNALFCMRQHRGEQLAFFIQAVLKNSLPKKTCRSLGNLADTLGWS